MNKTDIKPTVHDGGYKIISENWPNDKCILCNVKNDMPVKIPSFPYVLVNSILFHCGIEAENNFLLESITACHDTKSYWVMYFTLKTAFVNFFENLTDSLEVPILQNWTTHE